MRPTFLFTLLAASGVSLIWMADSQAAFTLTDKNNANPMTFTTSASDVYVMETKDNASPPSVPGNVAGFTFDTQNGSGAMLTNNASGDFRQGYGQSLAGNGDNGYVGSVLGKAWGNAITLSLGSMLLVNGPGADLYITSKNIIAGIVQTTSTQDKSFDIAFHVTNQGTMNGWHLYGANVLPTNFRPADGAGNVLGAIDLSDLVLSTGNNVSIVGLSAMPAGTTIDMIALVNSNSANGHAWGYLGNNSEAPTNFVARRDFDNADSDGNPYTGKDYLTGRYGTRSSNGQDGPQAWFLGLNNTVSTVVPEPSAFVVGLLECGVIGLVLVGRRLLMVKKGSGLSMGSA
jgi:hypothetical protein